MLLFKSLRTGIWLLFLATGAVQAQDLTPAHFYGTFQGSGFAEGDRSSVDTTEDNHRQKKFPTAFDKGFRSVSYTHLTLPTKA